MNQTIVNSIESNNKGIPCKISTCPALSTKHFGLKLSKPYPHVFCQVKYHHKKITHFKDDRSSSG